MIKQIVVLRVDDLYSREGIESFVNRVTDKINELVEAGFKFLDVKYTDEGDAAVIIMEG